MGDAKLVPPLGVSQYSVVLESVVQPASANGSPLMVNVAPNNIGLSALSAFIAMSGTTRRGELSVIMFPFKSTVVVESELGKTPCW